MRFEWDPAKARHNLRKHRISFEEAGSIFYDPLAATGADPDHSEEEERMITLGMSFRGRLLIVAHAERDNVIRIISARIATRSERSIYEEN